MPILKKAHQVPAVPIGSQVTDENGKLTQEYAHFLRDLADFERDIRDIDVLARERRPFSQEVLDAIANLPPGPPAGGASPPVALGTNGKVSTSGQNVTWVSGNKFSTAWAPGTKILIGGKEYTIQSVTDTTHLVVEETLPDFSSAWYAVGTELIVRNNDLIEVDVYYTAPTSPDWSGAAVYVEDPDISSMPAVKLDGSTKVDGSAGVSGKWAPVRVDDTLKSPAVVLLPAKRVDRDVRIYLASFGPNTNPQLIRANDTSNPATPSVVVTIPAQVPGYVSGMDHAWLVTDPGVEVNYFLDQVPPQYSFTFHFVPPAAELEAHRPQGLGEFTGCAIKLDYGGGIGNLTYAGDQLVTPDDINAQRVISWTSDQWPLQDSFQVIVYFVSESGALLNSVVPGVTPSVLVNVTAPGGANALDAPDVATFTITDKGVQWHQAGGFVAEAYFQWTLPANLVNYAGMDLYRVAVSAGSTTSVPYQLKLTGATDVSATVDVSNIPAASETWTIAAISVDVNGKHADDPATYNGGVAPWHSPTVTWTLGGAAPPGSAGQEYAYPVTVLTGAKVSVAERNSSDGIRQAQFTISGPLYNPSTHPAIDPAWSNPTSPPAPANQFGGVTVAMVVNGNLNQPTMWDAPTGATSFVAPWISAPGTYGSSVNLDFYLISRDQQGKRNTLTTSTPKITTFVYTPTQGQIQSSLLPKDWFNTTEFAWPTAAPGLFTANVIQSGKIAVGTILRVGDAPAGSGLDPSFVGGNGQIAVYSAPPSGKPNSVLQAWMGKQSVVLPGSSLPATVYGGWFSALYVGGKDPTTASFFVNNGGVVQVGGWDVTSTTDINGTPVTFYPYITLRDKTNTEQGRIGASLGTVTNPIPGGHSFNLQGAWFNQIAIGGGAWNTWKILTDDTGDIWIRDVRYFTIDYPQNLTGTPKNYEYQVQFGRDVWGGAGMAGTTYQFPGIRIFEIDRPNPTPPLLFGTMILNRGMVMRGTAAQTSTTWPSGYSPLGSLVMFNGDSTGYDDTSSQFWCELTMYSPTPGSKMNVRLVSGGGSPGSVNGSSSFFLGDSGGNLNFSVDQTGQVIAKTSYSMFDSNNYERVRLDYAHGLKLVGPANNQWFFLETDGSAPVMGIGYPSLGNGYYVNIYNDRFEMHSSSQTVLGMNATSMVVDGAWSPTGGFAGYLLVIINGIQRKIPYYPYP